MNVKFVKEFDALCETHGLGLDDALEVLAAAIEADRDRQDHEVVRALLDSAASELRHAAFDIYASYK